MYVVELVSLLVITSVVVVTLVLESVEEEEGASVV